MAGPILINARAAARPELGGVERWAREMERRLPELDPARYEAVRPPAALVHRAGHAWEQGVLPALAARRRASLLLSPANLAPLAFPRNVVVIHDAAALREPEWYSRLYVAWQRAVLPALARRAVHLVTVSQFSRDELVETLGADPARITVVPGGVDERFSPGIPPARRERPYVLTVASRTARKNLGALGETARRLAREGIDLLVAGGDRPQFRDDAATRAQGAASAASAPSPPPGAAASASAASASSPGGLTWLGHVPDAELPGLYAGALAFVLPSLYEGFGLTALEAMACGTPVVVSDRGALPEVVAEAGLFADPLDETAIADAVEGAIGDASLVAAGIERARLFSWERSAREVDECLRAASERHGAALGRRGRSRG
jgi:glycosyltransferase involved in cell wall biosynthesis